jgi:hypothetical protein
MEDMMDLTTAAKAFITRRAFLMSTCVSLGSVPSQLRKAAAAPFPEIRAYRDPGCGCCEKWVEHMKAAGFSIAMEDDENLAARKATLNVPGDLAGCHTAVVGEFVIEGHVPAEDIIRFLAEKPTARGLAVPGMPIGSPGMEMDGMKDAFDVMIFHNDGSRIIYARHT